MVKTQEKKTKGIETITIKEMRGEKENRRLLLYPPCKPQGCSYILDSTLNKTTTTRRYKKKRRSEEEDGQRGSNQRLRAAATSRGRQAKGLRVFAVRMRVPITHSTAQQRRADKESSFFSLLFRGGHSVSLCELDEMMAEGEILWLMAFFHTTYDTRSQSIVVLF